MVKKGNPVVRWGYVFFEDQGDAPARDWLLAQSSTIRQHLLNAVDAILWSKNPPRAVLPKRWASMKDIQGIDMSQYHEALAHDDQVNYRLFCRFDSSAASTKHLATPILVILDGKTKPRHSPMPTAEYQAIKDLWPRYYNDAQNRRCTPVEFPPIRVRGRP